MSATQHAGGSNPLDTTGLCLLSLDGGGVRGLSSLYILQGIVTRLNHQREEAGLPHVKPCEVFDLIGGTSTGGLIAIMLGRLEMDVDKCIMTYIRLMRTVFEEKSNRLPISFAGRVKAQFDSKKLKSAIEEVMANEGASATAAFNDGKNRSCRTFVCSTAKETAGITRLRNYTLPDEGDIPATTCEAALATSAATGFFDPVLIGARLFVGGALGANNPVEEVEGEAANIWCSGTGDLKPLVKCFISIGTGKAGKKAIEDDILKFLSNTLVEIGTETEETERKFIARWAKHYDEKRYFRFNVDQGLQEVGIAEYKEQGKMEAATDEYLRHQAQKFLVRDCVQNLQQKQRKTHVGFANDIKEFCIRIEQLSLNSRKTYWNVPFAKNTRFVGRDTQLNRLKNTLFAKDQPQKLAVYGLGGIGKTQIALELAHWIKEKYAEYSVFWVQATHAENIQQAFTDIAMKINVPGIEDDQADARKLVQRHLSQESVGQWLLIVDNVDDMDIWDNELKSYLPKSQQGSIVCTTRNRKVAVKIAGADAIKVPQMDEEMAMQLLSKLLHDKELLTSHQNAMELLERLTFLPLALVQAAAYINTNGIALSDYLSLLDEQEEDIISLLSEDFEDDWRYQDTKNPVATTWLISFKHIQRFDPLAAEYMSFMACMDPKDVPISLLPPERSQKKQTEAIGTLNAYAFVSRHVADRTLNVHRLVHLAMRNWLRGENLLSEWATKSIKRLEKVFPDDDYKNRNIWRLYLAHARYMLECDDIKEEVQERGLLVSKLAVCLDSDGRYNEAGKLFLEVVEARKRAFGPENPHTLISMGNLASTYRRQGRWKEAEELNVQVTEASKRVLGLEHPNTLTSMGNLASTYRRQGRWRDAEELEVQVAETSKRALGPEHPDTLTSMNNLALIYRHQGRWKEAEELILQVVEARKRVFGLEHLHTLTSMGNLASTYWDQGRWKEAEKIFLEVVEARKRVLGTEHPDTLNSMGNLALTYRNQGRWKEAEVLNVQVIEARKRVLGLEHPQTLTSMSNLASIYRYQGRWKEAEELNVQVTEASKRVLGLEHPDTLTSMGNLASIYRRQGRWREAEELEVQVTEASKRALGPENPHTLISMGNLASTYRRQGRWREAEELEVQVTEASKRVLGLEHPDTLTSMGNLASIYRHQGRWKEAEELNLQVAEARAFRNADQHG